MSGAYSISAICHSDGSQREGCFPLLHACDVFLWLRFYEMGVSVPVFSINPVFASVEIELVHPESDHEVFRLPQFLVGVPVFHADGLHDLPAVRDCLRRVLP